MRHTLLGRSFAHDGFFGFLYIYILSALRQLNRHRSNLVADASMATLRMQKVMQLMNIRLETVLRDVMGKSGRRIINAIISGMRDPEELANLASTRVKKSKAEIAASLHGQWQPELLYELKDQVMIYDMLQERIQRVDAEIETLFGAMAAHQQTLATEKENENKDDDDDDEDDGGAPSAHQPIILSKKKRQKNNPKFDVTMLSYKYLGVDLMQIEGIGYNTVMSFVAEVGMDIFKFDSAKKFAKWLRLAPDNRISGGRIQSGHPPKGKHRLGKALRDAANALGNCKRGILKSFFDRIAYRKGRMAAITATARKLAVIIWNLVVKKKMYEPMKPEVYQKRLQQNAAAFIKRTINKHKLSLEDLFSNTTTYDGAKI